MPTFSGNPVVNRPRGLTDTNNYLSQESFLEEAFRGEYSGTNLIYAGFAIPGANEGAPIWQISKMAYDGSNNLTSITWPINDAGAASSDYEFVWSDRAGYNYI